MKINTASVEEQRTALLENLRKEEELNGGYQKWYSDLESFRRSLRPYYSYSIGRKIYRTKETTISSGDIIDHHIISYLAPLNYRRRGWGGKYRTPSEQIIMLGEFLNNKGTRLIYAPLPNKCMVYPELLSNKEDLMAGYNAPQYRKILREIAGGG